MKVAITGAAGYVGSLLVRAHWIRGDSVHALARSAAAVPERPGVTRYGADLARPDAVPDAFLEQADVLYHCASEIADASLMQAVNVEAPRALLSRARGRVGRWVQVSSLSVYGTPRCGVIDEETPLSPRSAYARSKLEADELLVQYADAFSYAIVRPSAVIGPNMRNRSMHALVDAVARGRFCYIGPAGAIGNYVHEDNLVEALVLCASRDEARGRTYNVSQNLPIEAMIAAIASALGRTPPRLRIPEPLARLGAQLARLSPAFPLTPPRVDALTSRVSYPTDRIECELGYRHRKSVEDGLREVADLWKARR